MMVLATLLVWLTGISLLRAGQAAAQTSHDETVEELESRVLNLEEQVNIILELFHHLEQTGMYWAVLWNAGWSAVTYQPLRCYKIEALYQDALQRGYPEPYLAGIRAGGAQCW